MLGKFARSAVEFLKKEDGPTAVEYAVMLALIVVVCIAAITMLGSNANNTFGNVALNAAVKRRDPRRDDRGSNAGTRPGVRMPAGPVSRYLCSVSTLPGDCPCARSPRTWSSS